MGDTGVVRFDGTIVGLGGTSGVRVVVGVWADSPFGPVVDLMIERPDGHRILIAPTRPVADFIAATYSFDEVRVEPTAVTVTGSSWSVAARSAQVGFRVGRRTLLGWVLRAVPRVVSGRRWWVTAIDPVARVVLRGVRTVGTAGGGRREYYAAQDVHALVSAQGAVDGEPLGALTPVDPPVRFGFGSTPPRPVLTRITTSIVGAPPPG